VAVTLDVVSRANGNRTGQFKSRGFEPGGRRTEIPWDAYEAAYEQRALTWAGTASAYGPNPLSREAVPFGFDQRYAWPVFPRVPVDSAATSVSVLTQTARTLPSAANVVRAIDAVTNKPESASTVDVVTTALKQVAAVVSGVPNIMLEQPAIESVLGNDLRLSYNEGLDKLALDAIATAGFQAPSTDPLLTSIRKCVTTLWAAGYNPDVVILTPTAAETLDLLVSGISRRDRRLRVRTGAVRGRKDDLRHVRPDLEDRGGADRRRLAGVREAVRRPGRTIDVRGERREDEQQPRQVRGERGLRGRAADRCGQDRILVVGFR
jgi:hypothetical protein